MGDWQRTNLRLPPSLAEAVAKIPHGQRQYALAAGLLIYLGMDGTTQHAYREWVRQIAEGFVTAENPPNVIAPFLVANPARKRNPKRRSR